jgi:endonuclease/exonuclease/phosphatase (EEP) superfamily protein YafD
MLVAAGLALVTLFALSARLWWVFDLFSHFRLQYLVASSLFCIAAFAIRAYLPAAVFAIVALVHGFAVKDLWLGGTASAAPDGMPLRLVTTNVRADNPTPDQVLKFVRESDADLVVLVNAKLRRWDPVLAELRTLYPYQTRQSWGDVSPRALVILFSRFPVLSEKVMQAPRARRPYLVAEIEIRGETLVVVGVHSSAPTRPGRSRRRDRELDGIAEVVKNTDRPAVAAGDFNTTQLSPYFKDLIAAAGLRNSAAGRGYLATWPTWFWPALIPIDHVLLKEPLAVSTVRRGPAIGSDHYPIIADLRLLNR